MKNIALIALLGFTSMLFSQKKPTTKPPAAPAVMAPATPVASVGKPFFSVLDTYDRKSGEPIPIIIGNFPKYPNQILIQNDQGETVASCTLVNNVMDECIFGPKHNLKEVISVLLQAYQFTGPGASK